MIDVIDQKLKEWITTIIDGKFDVSFDHPGIQKGGSRVSIYLFSMENSIQRPSGARDIPLQITLCYLLTVHSEDQIEAHQYLGNLLFAAKSHADFEVEFIALSSHLWQAFGTPPLPHFCVRVPISVPRTAENIPKVKLPPRVEMGLIMHVKGYILGPDNQPIPDAKVTLVNSKTVARTNVHGLFSISADARTKAVNFKIEAKGQQFEKTFPVENIRNTPLKIHLNLNNLEA
ncbi:MAG: hypothetical protein DU480_13650 [Nitrosomonas sp.]|uniref:hypothetical protein n=1 Tax=Nitrosomonas sp. TaxID=42353 RepID=UPI0032EBC51F